MPVPRSVWVGATIGAGIGALAGIALIVNWHLNWQGNDEALEGATLLAAFLSMPTSLALGWISDIGDYPGRWFRFIVLAPAIQYGLLGAGIGLLVHRPRDRFAHRDASKATDT